MSKCINSLYLADCLDLMKNWYNKGSVNFIDLIYIDTPFNSNRNYNILFKSDMSEEAFKDTWSSVSYLDEVESIGALCPKLYDILKLLEITSLPKSYISYLTKMGIRCWYMREMLKDTGSLYYHCDPTMSHYIKMMLDAIFDINNFRNEIVWCYEGPSSPNMTIFAKKHDLIFRYSKTKNYIWNVDDIREEYAKTSLSAFQSPSKLGGERSQYINQGKYPKDWWVIPSLKNTKERLGYPTQKPEKLLERIILASSNEGDIVADFFMGGGTTIAVANKLNRRFIGSDINYRSLQITQKRLEDLNKQVKKDFFIYGIPRSSKELRKLVDDNVIGKEKNSKFELEDITIKYYLRDHNVIGNKKKVGDNSIDGYFMFSYNNKQRRGLVQVTAGSGINHLKSFCSEIGKGTGELGIYISFEDRITPGMKREVKSYGKLGHVDKIQILSFEDLIDNNKSFEKPETLLTI